MGGQINYLDIEFQLSRFLFLHFLGVSMIMNLRVDFGMLTFLWSSRSTGVSILNNISLEAIVLIDTELILILFFLDLMFSVFLPSGVMMSPR